MAARLRVECDSALWRVRRHRRVLGLRIGFLTYAPSLARLRTASIESSGSYSSLRGLRNFYFAECCRIFFTHVEKSVGRPGCRVRRFRLRAHFPRALPQLEIRVPRSGGGIVLRRTWIKTDRYFPARSCTRSWIFCGTSCFARPAHQECNRCARRNSSPAIYFTTPCSGLEAEA